MMAKMMIFETNNKQAGIDDNASNEVKRLLKFSLSRFEGAVTRVKIRFSDVNGPKGGIDKRCRISAKLRTGGQVVVSGEGEYYIEALSHSLERLVRSIRRKIEKRQSYPVRFKRRFNQEHEGKSEMLTEQVIRQYYTEGFKWDMKPFV